MDIDNILKKNVITIALSNLVSEYSNILEDKEIASQLTTEESELISTIKEVAVVILNDLAKETLRKPQWEDLDTP